MPSYFDSLLGQTSSTQSGQNIFSDPIALQGAGSAGPLGQSSFKVNPLGTDSFIQLPSGIRENRADLYSRTVGLGNDVQGDIDTLRGIENPFIRARVRPTEEKFARLRADTERGLARRGVQGTLATNEMLRIQDAESREVADQTAKAQMEALSGILQRQDFQQSLQNSLRAYTQDEVAQAINELQILSGQTVTSFGSVKNTGQTQTGEKQDSPAEGIGTVFDASKTLWDWFT